MAAHGLGPLDVIQPPCKKPFDADHIPVAGTVVRASRLAAILKTELGMDLRFVDISDDAKNRIRNYVQWSLIGDLEWETALDSI